MKKRSVNPIWDLLKKLNPEPTREKYLAIDRWEPRVNPSNEHFSAASAFQAGDRRGGHSLSAKPHSRPRQRDRHRYPAFPGSPTMISPRTAVHLMSDDRKNRYGDAQKADVPTEREWRRRAVVFEAR